MSELMSIREAAQRLGVSVDTVRQWERDKRLTAERTEGGHRRFRVEDIERLVARRSKSASEPLKATSTGVAPSAKPANPARGRPAADLRPESFLQGRLKDVRALTEIRRLQRESMEQQAEIDRRRDLARREDDASKRREEHRQRIKDLKGFGRSLTPAWADHEARAEIISEIEQYVTPERFPLELPPADARVVLQARVRALIARIEKERAEATAKADRERRCEFERTRLGWLIAFGVRLARQETDSWHSVDQARALRDLEEQLREEVRPDWSYDQVKALVADILSEFEEFDEDEEGKDPLDDEEDELDEED